MSTLPAGSAEPRGRAPQVGVFWWSASIQGYLGTDGCLRCVMAAYVARAAAYAALHALAQPWAVLPVQLLHGVTFGLYWSAANAYFRSIAPPGLEATAQVRWGDGGCVGVAAARARR